MGNQHSADGKKGVVGHLCSARILAAREKVTKVTQIKLVRFVGNTLGDGPGLDVTLAAQNRPQRQRVDGRGTSALAEQIRANKQAGAVPRVC